MLEVSGLKGRHGKVPQQCASACVASMRMHMACSCQKLTFDINSNRQLMSTADVSTVDTCLLAAVLLLACFRARMLQCRASCMLAPYEHARCLLPASLCYALGLAPVACMRMPHARACMLLLPTACTCMPQPVACWPCLARCLHALRAACLRCCLAHLLAYLPFVLADHMHACRTCWHARARPWLLEPGTQRGCAAVLALSDVALYAERELGATAGCQPLSIAAAACRAWRPGVSAAPR